MQLNYSIFYKQFGIRRLQNLMSPRLVDLNSLPRDAIIHHAVFDETHLDIDPSKLYYQNYTKKVLVDYPDELKGDRGKPRRKSVLIRAIVRPFHIQNKLFKYVKNNYELTPDPFTLLVLNYDYLDVIYKYVDMPMTKYNKWWNVQKTLWSTINSVGSSTSRNQFVFINVPKELPSYSFLKSYSSKTNLSMLKIFDTPDKLMLLEIWKWISDEFRSESVMADLADENIGKVTLVFTTHDNKSVLINLGYLNSWIKGAANTTEFSTVSQFHPAQLQKIFLKLMMTLQQITPEEDEVETSDEADLDIEIKDELDIEEENDLRDEELEQAENNYYVDSSIDNSVEFINNKSKSKKVIDDVDVAASDFGDDDMLHKHLASIDADIAILEKMNLRKLKEKGIQVSSLDSSLTKDTSDIADAANQLSPEEIKLEVFSFKDYETSLMGQLDDYTEYGMLSAMDYKKLVKDIGAYKNLKDPYGSKQTLVEAMVIHPSDIQLDLSKTTMVASDAVIDKSMLESSLLSFTEDYVSKVMHKDILAMTNGLQKAGIIIKKHEVELDNSALGYYENHTLELKPIDGVASTLRFRIPKVNEDGTFIAGGNKYLLRLQRIDNPIRKINPNSVALTSYFGKNFVTRSRKKADSYLEWIIKQLNKASMEDGAYITKIAPASVFDNSFNAPYIYNALADNFKSFKAGKYNLTFDHTVRQLLASEEVLAGLEVDGKIVTGITDSKELIIVDNNNEFFVSSKGSMLPIGSIFTILQLPEQKAPVDFTEIRIFSKTIPIGLVLAYFIGFNNLLILLGVEYRTVKGRLGSSMQTDEYSISFKDVSYIFSRKDKLNSLILGGFLNYEKQIKSYISTDFNTKDIYLNLLSSKGFTALYIRELELTDQLFVDSITKSILEEMNEPTTFKGLLIRATEMLQYYHHKDPQDMSSMRIRGYERVPGVIYKELSAAIRQFRNRNISGRSKVEMSPYRVWGNIMKDPAIKLVEDINPIQNLKESEIVTYVGEGGRSKNSMNKKSRSYHQSDMGIISEATVDSSDVGVNTYLSANPKFKNLRGLADIDNKELTTCNLMSTSANLSVGMEHEDPKRINV